MFFRDAQFIAAAAAASLSLKHAVVRVTRNDWSDSCRHTQADYGDCNA